MPLSYGCGGYIEIFTATDTGYQGVRVSCVSNLKSKGYNCNFGKAGPDFVGWDSAVGLGNHYGMDGSSFEPQWKLFVYTHLDWDWGPSSLLCKGYRAPSLEVKWPELEFTTHPDLGPRLKNGQSYVLTPHPRTFEAC